MGPCLRGTTARRSVRAKVSRGFSERSTALAPPGADFAIVPGRRNGMGIIEKTETRMRPGAADGDRFRLRGFIESLPADELETRSAPVDLADVAAALEDNPKAV